MNNNHHTPSVLHVVNCGTPASIINYETLLQMLEDACANREQQSGPCGIFYINFYSSYLDMLYGEDDIILIGKIEKKLTSLLLKKDVVARTDAYSYVVVRNDADMDALYRLAERIIQGFSEPCTLNGQLFYVYVSIGISYYPDEEEDVDMLIQIAEKKMRIAKKNGRNLINILHTDNPLLSRRQMELKKALPAAMENGQIAFVYQAQYSHKAQCFTGAEVLARWRHPVYGEILPSVFIPLAEQSGMIASLSVHAIIEVSKTFQLLEAENIGNFSLSVNISPLFLLTSHFYTTLEFMVEEYGLDRYTLHFEITEEVLFKHTDYLVEILHKIKQLGIKIELDDFGTGYTSVKQLSDLPLDTVKVDRSFIQNIHAEPSKQNLLQAIVEMTKVFDIDVIVEGVESKDEDQAVQNISPLTVQGYLYAKPEPSDALIDRITSIPQNKSIGKIL